MKFFIFLFFITVARAETWQINPDHSSVSFETTYLGVGRVRGSLDDIRGEVELTRKGIEEGSLSIAVKSLHSGNNMRDTHLKRADFFHVAQFPEILVEFPEIRSDGGATTAFNVVVSLKDRKIPLMVNVEISKSVEDSWGNPSRFVKARGSLKLSELPFKWNKSIPGGKLMLGEKIDLEADLQLQPKGKLTTSSRHMTANTRYIDMHDKMRMGEVSREEFEAAFMKKRSEFNEENRRPVAMKSSAVASKQEGLKESLPSKAEYERDMWFWISWLILNGLAFGGVTALSIWGKNHFNKKLGDNYQEGGKWGMFSDAVVLIPLVLFAVASYKVGWPG